jgi:hypothetical protein
MGMVSVMVLAQIHPIQGIVGGIGCQPFMGRRGISICSNLRI